MEWEDITEEKSQVDFGTAAAKSYILNNYETPVKVYAFCYFTKKNLSIR